jgi:hypothetical protein
MIGPLPSSGSTLVVVVVGSIMIFSTGAVIGANEAAVGHEPIAENESVPPLGEYVADDIRQNSSFPPVVRPAVAEFAHSMASLADYGAAIGYASVERIGKRATQIWLQALIVLTILGTGFRAYRLVRR